MRGGIAASMQRVCVLETWASPRESRARRSRELCPEPAGAECLVCASPSWLRVRGMCMCPCALVGGCCQIRTQGHQDYLRE